MSASAATPADRAALQRRLPPIIAGLWVLGPFAIDTYLPAFGSIAADLGASPLQVQQTLTAYIAPFALMALWVYRGEQSVHAKTRGGASARKKRFGGKKPR